ncbi:MAG: hypothetical protein WC340_17270 [Kiritimatiellia bacterium]
MKNFVCLVMLSSLLLPSIPATAFARGLELVQDGQPRAEIVVDRNAPSAA